MFRYSKAAGSKKTALPSSAPHRVQTQPGPVNYDYHKRASSGLVCRERLALHAPTMNRWHVCFHFAHFATIQTAST